MEIGSSRSSRRAGPIEVRSWHVGVIIVAVVDVVVVMSDVATCSSILLGLACSGAGEVRYSSATSQPCAPTQVAATRKYQAEICGTTHVLP